MVHTFVNIRQILTKSAPIDSPDQDLSIGIDLVKIWPVESYDLPKFANQNSVAVYSLMNYIDGKTMWEFRLENFEGR